jgi:hypothetical protein
LPVEFGKFSMHDLDRQLSQIGFGHPIVFGKVAV